MPPPGKPSKKKCKLSRKFIQLQAPAAAAADQQQEEEEEEKLASQQSQPNHPELFIMQIDIPKQTILPGDNGAGTDASPTIEPSNSQAHQVKTKKPGTKDRGCVRVHKARDNPTNQEHTANSPHGPSVGNRLNGRNQSRSSTLSGCSEGDQCHLEDTESMLDELTISGPYSSISEEDQSEDRDPLTNLRHTREQLKQEWQQLVVHYLDLLNNQTDLQANNTAQHTLTDTEVEVDEMQILNAKIRKLNCGVVMLRNKIKQQQSNNSAIGQCQTSPNKENKPDSTDSADKDSDCDDSDNDGPRELAIAANGQYQMEQFLECHTRRHSFELLFAEVGRLNKRTIRFRSCFNRKGEFVEDNFNLIKFKLDRPEFTKLVEWTDKLGTAVNNLIKAVQMSGPAIQYWLS